MNIRTKFAAIWLGLVLFFSFGDRLFAQSYLNILGIIRGDSLGSQFGKKVVSAGDVNGDTIPDFLVLATGDQKVYLYHGKKGGLDTLPDLIFEHKAQLDELGDINGDGKPDFAMRETGQNYRISLYFGGDILDTVPDGYIKGDSSGAIFGDRYGRYISAGKVSDSGDCRIIVGDPAYDDRGRVYVYIGRDGCFDSTAFWNVYQGAPFQGGGPALVLGDINRDGFADIGSNGNNDEIAIYLGRPVLNTAADLTLHGSNSFGERLAAVGDLNNDGFFDFVIGIGRTPLLFFGGSPLDTLPRFTLDRVADHFVIGGDINADGYNDLLAGRDDHPITGYSYVYYGGPTIDSVRDLETRELDLPFPADGFGQTVAGLGDVDGDGSNDFAVGSRSSTFDDQDRGYLWVFKGLLPNTGVDDGGFQLPKDFILEQNYPNPFHSSTIISFRLSHREKVQLQIFNILGQPIKVLIDSEQAAGNRQIRWDGADAGGKQVSSGIYLCRLTADGGVQTIKMTLIR